jgi:hypothetical protein
MKKTLIALCIVSLLGATLVFADQAASAYATMIPEQVCSISLKGAFGNLDPLLQRPLNALTVYLDLSPFTLSGDLAIGSNVVYRDQNSLSSLDLTADGMLHVGTSMTDAYLRGSADYKAYPLGEGKVPLYYAVGGRLMLSPAFPYAGGASFTFDFYPYAGLGIGKSHSISTVLSVRALLRHFGLEATDEQVGRIARVYASQGARLNARHGDTSESLRQWYLDLAQEMGIPERVLELATYEWIDPMARSIEMMRYDDVRYGWNLEARFSPGMSRYLLPSPGMKFSVDMGILGEYANFLVPDSVHFTVDGGLGFQFRSETTPTTGFNAEAGATVRYFPANPRWWVRTRVATRFNTLLNPMFDVTVKSEFDFLVAPNFQAYAGLLTTETFSKVAVFAGGLFNVR